MGAQGPRRMAVASKGLERPESTGDDAVAADLPRRRGLAGAGSKTPDSFPSTAFQSRSGLPAGRQTFRVRAGWTRQVSEHAFSDPPSRAACMEECCDPLVMSAMGEAGGPV